jgi:hypothetical protein
MSSDFLEPRLWIVSGLPTIHPEPCLSLPRAPFLDCSPCQTSRQAAKCREADLPGAVSLFGVKPKGEDIPSASRPWREIVSGPYRPTFPGAP